MRTESAGSSERIGRVRVRRGVDDGKAAAFSDLLPAEDTGSARGVSESMTTSAPMAGEALLVLQGREDSPRQKGVQVGGQMISALETLRESLLEEGGRSGDLTRLKRLVCLRPEPSGDHQLDTVLALIRQRTAVELAKLEAASDG